jgi:hypothetical protein
VASGVLRRPFSRGNNVWRFAVHRSARALGEAFWEGVKTVARQLSLSAHAAKRQTVNGEHQTPNTKHQTSRWTR